MNRKRYIDLWTRHALLREGERLTVYKDSEGKATVGIGHLVLPEDGLRLGDQIMIAQSRTFFEKDTAKAEAAALRQAREIGITADWFIAALISVNFQLGSGWSRVFKETYPAIVRHDFDLAIANLRQSIWYRQTPVRVEDFIAALEKAKSFKQRPLVKTKSIQGASVAGASVVAAEIVHEVSAQIEPLAAYSDLLQKLFIVLALCGIALTVYARICDRKRGYR